MNKQVKVSFSEDGKVRYIFLTRRDGEKVTFVDGRRGVTRTLWVCEEDGTRYVNFDGAFWELSNSGSIYGWYSNSDRRRLRWATETI